MTKYLKADFKFSLKVKDVGNPAGEKSTSYDIIIKCTYCKPPTKQEPTKNVNSLENNFNVD